MIGYIYLLLAIFGTAIGQLLLKKHSLEQNKISLKLLVALILFVSVPFFTYMSLKYIPFVIVFLSDAIAIIVIVLLSKIFLNEYLSKQKYIAVLLIILGILLLNKALNG